MSDRVQVTVDAHDPRTLSSFWSAALGYVHVGTEDERDTRAVLEDPGGRGYRLSFRRVPEAEGTENRLSIAVHAAPGLTGDERMTALEAECKRLLALGATRVRRQDPASAIDAGHIVMTDLEGNEFRIE
ncbi:VOC family protein [Streptomyces sp. NRRL S-340]|uniref:VOC family protein n=1 Tax=Streptomyces sp. NRRL S-340 TaxID=1463901 RepID=UPI0005691550|nr:VOC family protein [Streptomyces sp. NRRL S-340]